MCHFPTSKTRDVYLIYIYIYISMCAPNLRSKLKSAQNYLMVPCVCIKAGVQEHSQKTGSNGVKLNGFT